MTADAVLKLARGARASREVSSGSELILSLAYHEAGHAVAGVALGFDLHSIEIHRPATFLRGRAFFTRPPLAEYDPWYAVVGAAGPIAEQRWLTSEGLSMDGAYPAGENGYDDDWHRVSNTAHAIGCRPSVFCKRAARMMADGRVWCAVSVLAAVLAARLAQDGDFTSMPGAEALAIMGAHGVTPAFGLGRAFRQARLLPK